MLRAHQPHRREQHEQRDEERRDRVGLRVAGAHEQQADEHGDRAGEVAPEVQRVRRRARRCGSARAARHDATVRLTSIAITTPITASAYHARVDLRVRRRRRAARSRARRSRGSRARGTRPRRAPRGARPCRARTGGPCRRAAPRRRRRRRSAARRRGPCRSATASERRPRLCVARPVPSFSPISAIAANTETSAVRRCGLTARSVRSRSGLERPDDDVLAPRVQAERLAVELDRRDRRRARSPPPPAAAATARGGSPRGRAARRSVV